MAMHRLGMSEMLDSISGSGSGGLGAYADRRWTLNPQTIGANPVKPILAVGGAVGHGGLALDQLCVKGSNPIRLLTHTSRQNRSPSRSLLHWAKEEAEVLPR
jgi:hypothetical protein